MFPTKKQSSTLNYLFALAKSSLVIFIICNAAYIFLFLMQRNNNVNNTTIQYKTHILLLQMYLQKLQTARALKN